MAWRLRHTVVKGEIDNRQRGHVRGQIWLAGRKEPITLDLSGNCHRDLSGCLVKFENPRAALSEGEHTNLGALQKGVAGDMTDSRKVREIDVPLEEALRMSNE